MTVFRREEPVSEKVGFTAKRLREFEFSGVLAEDPDGRALPKISRTDSVFSCRNTED